MASSALTRSVRPALEVSVSGGDELRTLHREGFRNRSAPAATSKSALSVSACGRDGDIFPAAIDMAFSNQPDNADEDDVAVARH